MLVYLAPSALHQLLKPAYCLCPFAEVVDQAMIQQALSQLYGDAVRWLEGDFLDASMVPEHSVDMIFEHTCFCAIEPEQRSNYVKSAKHWLVPGGFLLGVFFTDPPPRKDGASGPPFGVSLDELRGLFGESFTITREQSPDRSHPDRLGREVIIEMVRNT